LKQVLFVDDDPALLEGLRCRLYRARSKWEMKFVSNAALAMEQLAALAYDVIVTDMRMARMDGAQLLEVASTRSPGTVRIVLSGYAEERQVMRLVPLAHRYISKPCEPDRLEEVIERCLRLQQLLQEPRIRAVVGRIRQLPALPRVYARLRELIAREDATATEVAEVISSDSAVTAKVLHVVNSAFFRLARPITRIEQAVVHLGFSAIRNLALSAEVFSAWPRAAAILPDFEPERLQDHARRVAAGAYALASGQPWADEALLAGLLHDIGYLILLQECPQEMTEAIALAKARAIPLHEAERTVLDATHAEVGAYLLGLWGLPYSMLEAVAFHHTPLLAPPGEFDLLAAVAISQAITSGADAPHVTTAQPDTTPIDAAYLTAVRAPFSWAEAVRRTHRSCSPEDHSDA
jgi:HD-like signal output (HDOD) protein